MLCCSEGSEICSFVQQNCSAANAELFTRKGFHIFAASCVFCCWRSHRLMATMYKCFYSGESTDLLLDSNIILKMFLAVSKQAIKWQINFGC